VQVQFGDLNGDGYDEVILGAWLADGQRNKRTNSGEVYVYFGEAREVVSGDSLDFTVIYGQEQGDRIGSSLATGDCNGDGHTDLLIGARYSDGPPDSLRQRAGEAFLLLGHSKGDRREVVDLRAPPDMTILGREAGDRLGRRIAVADLDLDGKEDLILAALGSGGPAGEQPDAGAVYIIYGDRKDDLRGLYDLSLEEPPVLYGADNSDGLGSAIAVCDWNGDALPDLVLGCGFGDGPANSRTNGGETYVLFGKPEERFAGERVIAEGNELTIYGGEAYDAAGISIGTGDFDGDGVDDIGIGANLADGPENGRDNCGEVYILFGSRTGHIGETVDLAYEADLTVYGGTEKDQFGSVIHLFDWNGDNYDDLIAASLLNDGPGGGRPDAGMLFVILGARQAKLRPRIDLSLDEADLYLLGPSTRDRIATTITHGQFDGKAYLLAATMLGDGPNDSRREAGEVYLLRWRPGEGD